eukprot:213796-Pleurochrysis_carterae.AAC.1
MRAAVEAMPLSFGAQAVVPGQLYFVDIPEFEGELRVGLGRAEAELSEDGSKRRVTWLQRRVWSNNPNEDGFCWQEIPLFKAARRPNSLHVQNSYEPQASFLPIMPELTESWSAHDASLPLSHKKQKIKLTKKSVAQLFEFVRLRRPELLRSSADTAVPATGASAQPDVAEAPAAAPALP